VVPSSAVSIVHAKPDVHSVEVMQRFTQKKVRVASCASAMHAPSSTQSASAWQPIVHTFPAAFVPSLRVYEISVHVPIAHETSPPQCA
jgi:hypothetical protein